MSTDNTRTTRLQLREHRTDSGDQDASVIGFKDDHGLPRAVVGDFDAPWIKAPPFTTPAETMFEGEAVPISPGAAYAQGPEMQVADFRSITLYLLYSITGGSGQLSLVPEARIGLAGQWVPLSVIDLTPTVATLGPPFGPGFISRNIAMSELRFPALAAAGSIQLAVAFDTTPFEAFRFSYAELDAAATNPLLSAFFSLNQ